MILLVLYIQCNQYRMSLICTCRGVYLACLLYHGDKVLVTSDDQLPIVEVDENFTGPSVNTDLHWLMKVCTTTLRQHRPTLAHEGM